MRFQSTVAAAVALVEIAIAVVVVVDAADFVDVVAEGRRCYFSLSDDD